MNDKVTNVSAIGFFTVMLLWTLNGDSGRDMNDVIVEYWQAKTALVKKELRNE